MHLFDGHGERLLTLKEAAAALDYDEEYVSEHAKKGVIPGVRTDGEWLFSKSALERWILGLAKS